MDQPSPAMFADKTMNRLAGLMNLESSAAAKGDFVALGEKIRAIIDETPSSFARGPDDISLSRRARWLRRHVLNPSQLLRDALCDDPRFAQYPEEYGTALTAEERGEIAISLERLDAFARDLHDDLEYRSKQKKLSHNIEMRREFIFWIAQVVNKHARGIRKVRSYTGIDAGNVAGKSNGAPFFAAVKLAYVEITGEKDPQLDDHFKEIVRMKL